VNGHSAASQSATIITRPRDDSGASRAERSAITKQPAVSNAACASIAARIDFPATAKIAARNAGYPGTRMSTGVNRPLIAKPYTPFFSQFQASSM
jgi:hypothetical protein